jgi:hypothetical protein
LSGEAVEGHREHPVALLGRREVEARLANPVIDMRMMRRTAAWTTNLPSASG